MLRIGNQTSFAAVSWLDPFEFALAHGFTAFEFFPDRGPAGDAGWHEAEVDGPTRRAIRRAAAERNIVLTVHAPLEISPPLRAGVARLEGVTAFASEIGATLLNLHLDMRHGLEAYVLALKPALDRTAESGLRLAIENTVWTGPGDFNRLFALLRDGGIADPESGQVGMTLDVGHANLYQPTRNDYWGYCDQLAGFVPLIHLHLHENYGDFDSHLTVFSGPSARRPEVIAGLFQRLALRQFAGCVILEQWPRPPSLLVDARDGLVRLLQHSCPAPPATQP